MFVGSKDVRRDMGQSRVGKPTKKIKATKILNQIIKSFVHEWKTLNLFEFLIILSDLKIFLYES